MNFASRSVIYENLLGLLHAAKLGHGTYYFTSPPKEGILRIFPDVRKIQRLRPGLNSRTRVPVASMLTTRTPKPSVFVALVMQHTKRMRGIVLLSVACLVLPYFFHIIS